MEQSSQSVQLTCLGLFRKIISSDSISNGQKEEYFKQFVPQILSLLNRSPKATPVIVEAFNILDLVCEEYPSLLLNQFCEKVLETAGGFKSHPQRIVRKFARGTINEWSMIN